jgi:hypothetical protein
MIMLGILIAWILFFTVGFGLRFNPTSVNIVGTLIPQLVQNAKTNLVNGPVDERGAWIQQLQAILPDLCGWVLTQSGLAVVGILFMVAAAVGFRRFRNELG